MSLEFEDLVDGFLHVGLVVGMIEFRRIFAQEFSRLKSQQSRDSLVHECEFTLQGLSVGVKLTHLTLDSNVIFQEEGARNDFQGNLISECLK